MHVCSSNLLRQIQNPNTLMTAQSLTVATKYIYASNAEFVAVKNSDMNDHKPVFEPTLLSWLRKFTMKIYKFWKTFSVGVSKSPL